MKTPLIHLLVGIAGIQSILAKEFTNLNFDEGPLPLPPFEQLQPADLILPGWTAKMGDQKLSYIGWNAGSPTHGGVSIFSQTIFPTAIEGRYGMYLSGGPVFPTSSPYVPASVSQTGLIPATANSLLFRAEIFSPTEVTLGGQVVPHQFLGEIPVGEFNITYLYGVDVRNFAGQEVELSFINYRRPNSVDPGAIVFDSLTFSTAVVPEPSTWALFVVGGMALFRMGRRRI